MIKHTYTQNHSTMADTGTFHCTKP